VPSLITIAHDITERKKMEDTLRESEKRWQLHAVRFSLLSEIAGRLLESPEPLALVKDLCTKVMQHLNCQVFFNFITDDNKDKLHLNAYAGISEIEAKSIEWLDNDAVVRSCLSPDEGHFVVEHIQSQPDERTEIIRSYGVKAYACNPILTEGGKVVGMLSFGTRTREVFSESDLEFMKSVTDHVAVAMERLNFVKELNGLARYLRDNPSPVLRISKQGIVLYANEASSLLLNGWNCRVNDKAPEQVRRMAAQCIGAGHTAEYEVTCGNIIYSLMFSPVAAEGFVNVYGRDITKRKKTELELIETRDYLENLLNYANAPIICWDSEFKITRFNHAFENLSGHKAEEVLGRDLSMLFPRESREETIEKINRTFAGEHWEDVEIPILSKDGDIRIVLWNSANIYARDNTTLLATIAQGHDITERKKA
jgi:PAS domain S-box-containing protein